MYTDKKYMDYVMPRFVAGKNNDPWVIETGLNNIKPAAIVKKMWIRVIIHTGDV